MHPCENSIKLYFETIFSYCEGYIPLRSFPEKAEGNTMPHNIWVENDPAAANKAITFARWANENNLACYVIPGTVDERGKASAANITQMQALLIDIDEGDIHAKYEHLVKHLGLPTLEVESGGITSEGQKKLHLYWKLSEVVLSEDLPVLLNMRHLLAIKAGGDMHFQSAHQPIRIAGSIYHKHGQEQLVSIREARALEYHLSDIIEKISSMPALESTLQPSNPLSNPLNFNNTAPALSEVFTTQVHEGGKDEWTRFEGLSRVIGYWLRRHHDGLISYEEAWEEILAYNSACVVPPWEGERLKAETNRLWKKHIAKYGKPKPIPQYSPDSLFSLSSFTVPQYVKDLTPIPEDIIAPSILTPGGSAVLAGAPKVGKSDFLLSLLVHMALGINFLNFAPPRPLKIFYLQMEVRYFYVRKRLQRMELSEEMLNRIDDNLHITPHARLILNDQGLECAINHIREKFSEIPPDIIAVDPIRSVLDGDENDNSYMLHFLHDRVHKLQEAINPNAGVILVHHIRKISKKQFEEDPFNAISGAGALRAFYNTGIILFRPDENKTERKLVFELRDGDSIAPKIIDKINNQWVELSNTAERLVNQHYGQKLDAERIRKGEKIVEIIYEQAKLGKVYNISQFAEKFENKHGFGSKNTINERIKVCATKGYIKFFRNYMDYELLPPGATKFGYMCVESMYLGEGDAAKPVYPTHYKHPQSGMPLEVENPRAWVYNDEEE